MTTSYDASVIGGLRTRASRLIIEFPPNDVPTVHIEQFSAVTMNDGSTQHIQALTTITAALDLVDNGNTPIQMVDFNTGAALSGQTTTLNSVVQQMLAVIRSLQLINNP